jgi:hypothetical protein
MVKWIFRNLHQSWVVVMGAIGVVMGVVLGTVFRVSFFSSWWFLVLSVGLLIFTIIKPKFVFMVLALVAGMILAFFRIAGELEGEAYIGQFYGERVVVTGEVSGDPEVDEKGIKVKLVGLRFGAARDGPDEGEAESGRGMSRSGADDGRAVSGSGADDGRAVSGSIYVTLKSDVVVRRSDTLVLDGKLTKGFSTYAGYMYAPQVLKV